MKRFLQIYIVLWVILSGVGCSTPLKPDLNKIMEEELREEYQQEEYFWQFYEDDDYWRSVC